MITAAHPFEKLADSASPHQVKVVLEPRSTTRFIFRGRRFHSSAKHRPRRSLRHQGIYGYTRELLLRFVRWKPSPLERAEALEQLRALENGVRIRVVVTGGGWPGVDTPADVEAVERELVRAARLRRRRRTKERAMKYIFITGGVISSFGKGLAAAALGTLLELRGLRVVFQKFDPYLNVDPGTMNPFQHGEVYVLNDGAETDLDLGHYERFTNCILSRHNNLTSGQVYESVILKERRGDYLGKTVQVIPHVTDEIKNRIREVSAESKADVLITEIGGTTGDIEGLPFPGGDPAIHSRSRPAERDQHARHAGAVHQGGGRIEDQADAAKRGEVARDRHAAAGAALPHGNGARRGNAAEALDVLQRLAESRDRSAGRAAHDLRSAADAARRRAGRARLRAAALWKRRRRI